jgi:hypothetical protein
MALDREPVDHGLDDHRFLAGRRGTFLEMRSVMPPERIRWVLTIGLGLCICAAPLLFWGKALRCYFLKLDDFFYLAESRTGASLLTNLFKPHNAHVIPLFRIETYFLSRLAGTLQRVPEVLGIACFFNLLLAMLLAGHLVTRETWRVSLGLVTMAGVGMSTVLGPAVLWYAAGQALASGTVILAMLIALSAWTNRGGRHFLLMACLAAVAAPMFWSAGYTAGPVAAAYLVPRRRTADRIAAFFVLAASLMTGGLLWLVARHEAHADGSGPNDVIKLAQRIPAGLALTVQAIPEILIINNLGLDAPTTSSQGLALCAIVALSWCVLRNRTAANRQLRLAARPMSSPHVVEFLQSVNRLEAAGAVLIVASFWLIYTARGDYSFDNLRALGWYHALPQLGAVLLAFGWRRGNPAEAPVKRLNPPTFAELAFVAGLTTVLLLLQMPRANRVIFDFDGAAAAIPVGESESPPRPASWADLVERARKQQRALARLDRVEKIARERETSRSGLREAIGRLSVPGLPVGLTDMDAIDLLSLPESGSLTHPEAIRAAVTAALSDESP